MRPHSYDPSMVLYSTQRYYDLNKIVRCCATHIMFSSKIKNTKEWTSIKEDYADMFGGEAVFQEMINKVQEDDGYNWLYLNIEDSIAYKNFTEQLYPKNLNS